jgi:hypothetical protein
MFILERGTRPEAMHTLTCNRITTFSVPFSDNFVVMAREKEINGWIPSIIVRHTTFGRNHLCCIILHCSLLP